MIASDAQNVVIVPYAVGEERGEAYLQVPVRNVGGAKVSMVAGGERVALMPFMEILYKHNIHMIDGIKIDIEGSEDYVLFPLFQDQNRHLWPRGVVIEHLHRTEWPADCFEILRRSGYERVGETESNAMFRKKGGS